MSRLLPTIFHHFFKEEHVLRHREGIWNGIWSDMMIETSYMKFGRGPNGIIGKDKNAVNLDQNSTLVQ